MKKLLAIKITERTFHFKQPAGTSRGIYTTRRSWFVEVSDGVNCGVGECAPLPQLSCDDVPEYGRLLRAVCDKVEAEGRIDYQLLRAYPSMLFGLETAMAHLQARSANFFDTAFSRGEKGIPINGLVWMGDYDTMLCRIEEKLEAGFRCVKLKVGAIDFEQELEMVKRIRSRFSHHEIEIRLDANGGFPNDEALHRLYLLSQYVIHSIEQPIKARQWGDMAELCRESPLPIALDEELIGINQEEAKRQMLHIIKPAYIVLKPSLHGGMKGCEEWISIACDMRIGSWITSALESNIGLNAIAQFAAKAYGDDLCMPQGLGTGLLYTDNVEMPLQIKGDQLWRV